MIKFLVAELRILIPTVGLLMVVGMSHANEAGTRFPDERKSFVDPATGMKIIAITTHPASDIKIYQTHPQWSHDGNFIVFRSKRTGKDQYFAYEEATGELIQLTDSEVGKICLSRKEGILYYLRVDGHQDQARALVRLDTKRLLEASKRGRVGNPENYEHIVTTFPEHTANAGGFSLDAHEKVAYVGIHHSDTRWSLDKVDLANGERKTLIELPWRIGHIQANPWKTGEIVYCHETGGDAPQRMWMINGDGSGNKPLYEEAPTEWATHEVWVNKDTVMFNLGGGAEATDPRRRKPHGITTIDVRTNEVHLFDQLPGGTYWHCAALPDLNFAIGDSKQGDLYHLDLINGGRTLLTAKHLPNGGPAHPHQNISPDGKRVLFGSDWFGNPDIMILKLPTTVAK